jgi:hypothetical protein
MSTIDATSSFLSQGALYRSGGETGAADRGALASTEHDERQLVRKAWNDVVDYKLIEWGRDPGLLDEDELIPPSSRAIDVAIRLARHLRDQGSAPPPTRVAPDGDGGIIFERWVNGSSESFEISDGGEVEYVLFHNGRVVIRES